jgi:hypothetical protein
MQVVSFPARQARSHYRHELRTLTYVTLDAGNGGIIRNLNSEGVAVQAVAPLRHEQRVRLRFELRFPRLRVDTYGQVSWAGSSGQCGIRFVDLPAQISRQIDQWIFSNLLDEMAREDAHGRPIFANLSSSLSVEENSVAKAEKQDGLTVSATYRQPIRIEPPHVDRNEPQIPIQHQQENLQDTARDPDAMNWLARPISPQTLAWTVDSLVMIAGLLLFALIFLSIAHELPPWPLTVGAGSSVAVLVAGAYWALFVVFGGASLGARLAGTASALRQEEKEQVSRFR